jgi:hypothetical protein
MRYVDWMLPAAANQPVAVYTQFILLMMSSKPARNM